MSQKFQGWIHTFTVTDSIAHKKGYTIYKITSIIFPRSLPQALSCLTVWKRFHEVKKLFREVQKKHKHCKLKGHVPEPRDYSYFKRFESDVIENRRSYIVELLDFVAQHPALYKSEPFVQFFENGQSPGVSPAHMATYQTFEDSNGEVEGELDSKIMVEAFIKDVAEKAVESQDQREKDYLKMLTPMASFEDEDADYIYEAALEFSRAVQAEVLSEYQEAYDKYKSGVERLINGTKDDQNEDRKQIAKSKIVKYLARADEIYDRFILHSENERKKKFQLSLDLPDGTTTLNKYLERPWSHLSKYKVVNIKRTCMLVQSVVDKSFYIMKSIEKPSSHSPAQSVFLPQSIPYMVDLMAFFQSDEKIFLLLQYAKGGNLFDYIQNYVSSEVSETRHQSINEIFDDISPDCEDPDNIEDMVLASQKLLRSVSKTLKEVKQIEEVGARKEYHSSRKPFPVECIKQWARELLTAIESLHMKGVILRDLHRDNILMGANGELLLSYFYQNEGINSVLPDRVSQKAVESEFVAPDLPLTMKSDWWSYGVLLYELLTGHSFSTMHRASIFSYNDVLYPEDVEVPEDGKDLLRNLIEKSVVERFDVKQIKNHKFFENTIWEDLRNSVVHLD